MKDLGYIKGSFYSNLQYKSNTLLQIIGTMVIVFIQYYLWIAIGENTNIKHFRNILLYVVLSRIILSLYPDYNTINFVSNKILKGDIVYYLVRPIQLWRITFANEIGVLVYNILFILSPTVILTMLFLDVHFEVITLTDIIFFVLSFLCAYILSFLLSYAIAKLSIWLVDIWGILEFYHVLLLICGGTLIPLNVYPEIIQKILLFFPFQSMFYTPLSYLTGTPSIVTYPILVQLLWIGIFIIINIFIDYKVKNKSDYMGG